MYHRGHLGCIHGFLAGGTLEGAKEFTILAATQLEDYLDRACVGCPGDTHVVFFGGAETHLRNDAENGCAEPAAYVGAARNGSDVFERNREALSVLHEDYVAAVEGGDYFAMGHRQAAAFISCRELGLLLGAGECGMASYESAECG